MEQQIQHSNLTLCSIKGIQELENCVSQSNMERSLLELVRLRTSQINDCGQCRDLFTDDAQSSGQSPERLDALQNWRESGKFNDREKAALAWTEAITSSSRNVAANALYDSVRKHFDEHELVVLSMTVNLVDTWSRLSLAIRPEELSLVNDNSN